MILNGYCYYNRKIGAFTAPQFLQFSKEQKIEGDQRAFLLAEEKDKVLYEEMELHHIGTFDDVSGELKVHKPEFLCNFASSKGKKMKNG